MSMGSVKDADEQKHSPCNKKIVDGPEKLQNFLNLLKFDETFYILTENSLLLLYEKKTNMCKSPSKINEAQEKNK